MNPVVAIVGRPNVGKSTLFNVLVGERVSIVEPTAGVTRDRVVRTVDWGGRTVELVDTGGIGIVDMDRLEDHVEQQIQVALHAADVIVFLTSVRDGVTPLDREIAGRLRQLDRPVVLAANKADEAQHEPLAGELFALGFGEPVVMSAVQSYGKTDLVERVLPLLPEGAEEPEPGASDEGIVKIAVVGKRNAGKSTFVNALAREERVIASEVPGTTRDAVDVRFERDGETYIAIDTAGMRKRRKVGSAIELFSQVRTEQSIDRADVVLLLFDVTTELSQVDKALAERITEKKKPCVLVANKWDLARAGYRTGEFHEYVQARFPSLGFSPIVFTSALERKGVWQTFQLARELYEQASVRVTTGELNRVVEDAMKAVKPRIKQVVPRIYYATQTGVRPPRIVLMVNKPALFDDAYRRYLMNRFRERCGFTEVPIDLVLRERLTQYVDGERREREQRRRGKEKTRRRRDKRGGGGEAGGD